MTWHMDTCDGCTWHHMTYCHHSGPDTCQCHGKHVVTKYRQNTETTACCYLILENFAANIWSKHTEISWVKKQESAKVEIED